MATKYKNKNQTPTTAKQTYQIGNTLMSEADYNVAKGLLGFESGKGGTVTPEVQKVVQQNVDFQRQLAAERKIAQENVVAQGERQAVDAAVQTQNGQEQILTQTPTQQNQDQPTQQNQDQTTQPIQQTNEQSLQNPPVSNFQNQTRTGVPGFIDKTSNVLSFGRTNGVQQELNPIKAIGAALEETLSTAASVIDAVTSSFSARKSAKVTTAETALNDAFTALNTDIVRVKMGDMRYDEAKKDFQMAEAAVNRLDKTTKGLGKLNLRFWLGGGAEVENEIILSRQRLEDLKVDLLNARARASIGL